MLCPGKIISNKAQEYWDDQHMSHQTQVLITHDSLNIKRHKKLLQYGPLFNMNVMKI